MRSSIVCSTDAVTKTIAVPQISLSRRAISIPSPPGGGPSYPLATPGVRVALKPNDKWSLMLGVYNGDPAGAHCTGNPQVCDDNGLDFRLDSPPLLIAEGRYNYQDGRLPGTIKIGG